MVLRARPHGGRVSRARELKIPVIARAEMLGQTVDALAEKASAVENLEALLSVKGVDMVQFGPADYSMSIGLAGQWNHPRVVEAERHGREIHYALTDPEVIVACEVMRGVLQRRLADRLREHRDPLRCAGRSPGALS